MDQDSPEAWGVAYLSDSGKALTLDKLFLCKNCEPIEDQVRVSLHSKATVASVFVLGMKFLCKECEPIVDHGITVVSYTALNNGDYDAG